MTTNTTQKTIIILYHCSGCDYEAGQRNAVKKHIEKVHTISPVIERDEVNKFDRWERDKYE